MQAELYLEDLLLQQFVWDFWILILASAIRGIAFRFWRCFAGAMGGAILWMMLFITFVPFWIHMCTVLTVGIVVMAVIAFPVVSFRNYIKNCGAILAGGLFLGGIGTFLGNRIPIVNSIPVQIILISVLAPVTCVIVRRLHKKRKLFYPVKIEFEDGEVIHTIGLLDTGNCLRTEDGEGVCLLESRLRKGQRQDTFHIPYSCIGDASGVVSGEYAGKLIVFTTEGTEVRKNVPIAYVTWSAKEKKKYEMILQGEYV